MKTRDFAFWLQGCFENGGTPIPAQVIAHAELVLVSERSDFAIAAKSLAELPEKLKSLVEEQFIHVIDRTFPPIEKDPAHKPLRPYHDMWQEPPRYRC